MTPSCTVFLGTQQSPPQTGHRFFQSFFYGMGTWQTDNAVGTLVAIVCIWVIRCCLISLSVFCNCSFCQCITIVLYNRGDHRTEAVLRQLQQRAPVMSDAEKEALSELKDIKVLLSSYTSKIKMVLICCFVTCTNNFLHLFTQPFQRFLGCFWRIRSSSRRHGACYSLLWNSVKSLKGS